MSSRPVSSPARPSRASSNCWRGNLDFYMGGAPEMPRLNSRLIESGHARPLAVVSGANPGHTSLVLATSLQPKTIDEILNEAAADRGLFAVVGPPRVFPRLPAHARRRSTSTTSAGDFCGIAGGNMVPALLTGQIDGFLHSEPPPRSHREQCRPSVHASGARRHGT